MPGQILPEKTLKRTYVFLIDRKAAVDCHRILAGINTKSPAIIRFACAVVVVQVELAIDPRITGSSEHIGILDRLAITLRNSKELLAQQFRRLPPCIVVNLVDQQDVGSNGLDDRRDFLCLSVPAVTQSLAYFPRGFSIERSVVSSDSQRILPQWMTPPGIAAITVNAAIAGVSQEIFDLRENIGDCLSLPNNPSLSKLY